ncbi:MAG: DinB family protein [Promethearchaeota archaeon]
MELLKRLGRYLLWADSSVWDIVKTLTDDEFIQSPGESMRSIRDRYVHLAQDTWEWYHDWTGEEPEEEPDFDQMTREGLYESVVAYSKRLVGMVEDRSVDNLEFDADGKKINLRFDEFLFHMVNHATYHRGQIVAGLRLLGKETQMTDYVPFRIATEK